jgi:hypothetical protein
VGAGLCPVEEVDPQRQRQRHRPVRVRTVFFSHENPDFQIDSAYWYTMSALADFQVSSVKERDKMKRFPLDSLVLVRYRQRIDSAAFVRARHADTEEAYLIFLGSFPLAAERDEAKLLRDAAAYRDATKENTFEAFLRFLQKYPQASQAVEARAHYDRLLFQARTADKRLSSYRNFLKQYPQTPHRREVEKNIFEITTASGTVQGFEAYLAEYPSSSFSSRARNILYHLLADEHTDFVPPSCIQSDSLSKVARLAKGYLVPFLSRGNFGFMDPEGKAVIADQAREIGKEYLCGNITEDLLVLPDKIVSRNGAVVFAGTVTSLEDLGYGFLTIETKDCIRVLHKTGFSIGDGCIQDAKALNGKLLALQKNNRWSVWTLAGKMLQPYTWDDISFIKDVILFHKNNKIILATTQAIAAIADQEKWNPGDSYDEVKRWPGEQLWVRNGERQGVLNQTLGIYVELEKQVLNHYFFGCAANTSEGIKLFNMEGKGASSFKKIEVSDPWVVVKTNESWRLFDPGTLQYASPSYDSMTTAGPFAVGMSTDSVRFYFNKDTFLDIRRPARFEFVPGKDSSSFLMVDQDDKKTIYDHQAHRLFTVACDKVQYGGQGLFIIHKKEKKGLVNAQGKLLLPVEYDAIGSAGNDVISLLKSMKFGLFDHKKRKLIKPQYDKNLVLYNGEVITAFKDGAYGFLGWDNKPLGKFEFNEIRYWSDTTALVKKNFQWMLYSITSGKVALDKIKNYKLIHDTPDEKLAIIHQENNYGVIHSKKGVIIPLTFSDIVNVGSPERPTYFTEKHVEEASIFVVIYYDSEGRMLRKEVYEQEDYDRIYCTSTK